MNPYKADPQAIVVFIAIFISREQTTPAGSRGQHRQSHSP